MTLIKIPTPISGGVLLSYKCSAACRHCLYACSPQWPGDWMSPEDLKACLAILAGKIQASPYGRHTIHVNYGLHFTGGEPFLNFDLLLKGVRLAREYRLPGVFVETNCSWCATDAGTREKLEVLKDAGMKGILISVNPFYAEHVPFERTERGIDQSVRVFGDNVIVYQWEYYKRFKKLGVRERLALEDYLARTRPEPLAERVELFLMGRAAYRLREHFLSQPAGRLLPLPCPTPLVRGLHNHFDNYGNFMPGFCGGISLGPWRDLERLIQEGLEVTERPVLGFLLTGDFAGLYDYARERGYQEKEDGYVSKCHLCVDLRRHLASQDECAELAPREFYRHLE